MKFVGEEIETVRKSHPKKRVGVTTEKMTENKKQNIASMLNITHIK